MSTIKKVWITISVISGALSVLGINKYKDQLSTIWNQFSKKLSKKQKSSKKKPDAAEAA